MLVIFTFSLLFWIVPFFVCSGLWIFFLFRQILLSVQIYIIYVSISVPNLRPLLYTRDVFFFLLLFHSCGRVSTSQGFAISYIGFLCFVLFCCMSFSINRDHHKSIIYSRCFGSFLIKYGKSKIKIGISSVFKDLSLCFFGISLWVLQVS